MANLKAGRGISRWLKGFGAGTVEDPMALVTQDLLSTTPIIMRNFHLTEHESTIAIATAKDAVVVNVADASTFVVGNLLTIWSIVGARWYQGKILSIATNAVTVDTPVDYEYQIGDTVSCGTINMAVDGSVTPKIFSLRSSDPGIPLTGVITRIIIEMTTTTEPGWNEFGDLAALTKGIVLRRVDGTYQNILNVKTNAEMAGVMFDLNSIDATKFGVYGIKARLTFTRIGAGIELGVGDDLQLIINDNLSTLVSFTGMAQGVIVL